MITNFTYLFVSLFRAIEIAKLGDLSISVVFDTQYQKGGEDYKAIKEFTKGWFDNYKPNGDLRVEMYQPTSYIVKKSGETLETIQQRIDKAKQLPTPQNTLNEPSEHLLKTATNRLNLSINEVNHIVKISQVIAQLNLHNKIEVEDIAEAIHYFMPIENKITPENNSINFGEMIEFKLGDINSLNANEAIQYLTQYI